MKGEPIDDARLAAILAQEENSAIGFHDGTLSQELEVAIAFYEGRPFGDEEEGRSQFVTRDVAETVDHMTVSVLRAFVSGDHVVEFEGGADAKDATIAIHQQFMRKQSGYRVIHDWLKGGLSEKISFVKTCVETEEKVERETLEGVPALQLAMIQEEGANVVAADEVGQDETGDPVFNITVETNRVRKVFRDYHLPLEEVRWAPRSRCEDSTGYIAHVSRKTRSQLVEMGFDPEVVFSLPHEQGDDFSTSVTYNRFRDEDGGGFTHRGIDQDPASQEVLLCEEYIRIDADGDGIAELLCVHRVKDTILDKREIEEHGLVAFTPFPLPNRMVGQSLSDKVMDIQRLRSVLVRQGLDALYLANAPRTLIAEESIGDNTIDDLLTVRPGAIIRYKGPNAPVPYTNQFAADSSFAMLEFATGERESRTGITRLNQGLDRDALNKTATGTAMMQAQGQQIEEYIARNFGECLARLFAKKLRLLVEHGAPFTINVEGKPKEVDPRAWAKDMDMNIQVGLGSGKKDQRLMYRQMVVELQSQAVAAGMSTLVTPKQLFNSAAGIIADANLGAATEYFVDPDSEEGQQAAQAAAQNQQPDPETMKVQAEMQAKQAEMQMKGQELQMKQQAQATEMQLRAQEAELKLELTREEAAAKIQLERERAEAEATLAQQRLAFEMEQARERFEFEKQMAQQKAALDHEAKMKAAENKGLPKQRPGGSLAE